jgi:hypothetical protein
MASFLIFFWGGTSFLSSAGVFLDFFRIECVSSALVFTVWLDTKRRSFFFYFDNGRRYIVGWLTSRGRPSLFKEPWLDIMELRLRKGFIMNWSRIFNVNSFGCVLKLSRRVIHLFPLLFLDLFSTNKIDNVLTIFKYGLKKSLIINQNK